MGGRWRKMDQFVVGRDDPWAGDVQALIARHLAFAHTHSPHDDVHALDTSGLVADNISFFSVRENGELLGIGALKQLDPTHAELKSMHTAQAARGRGIGRAMLEHLLGLARSRGCTRVSLETGSMAAFAPAHALYLSAGFTNCEPFDSYADSPNSICMTLALTDAPEP